VSLVDQFLKEVGGGSNIRDYQHASKLFVSDNYRLAPKSAWLFYVSFDLDPNISLFATAKSQEILEAGMLVKTAQLPKFTIENKTMNAYNRVNIVQNKVKYDPIQITFHDDNADVVRDFWYNYYHYYFRDSDYSPQLYTTQDKYSKRTAQDWGYTPRKNGPSKQLANSPNICAPVRSTYKMLTQIKIYSLHQKRFTEYILINPTITSFAHGVHDVSQTNSTLENTMTVAYEAVLYNYGAVNADTTVDGFATLHYDNTPSPLTPQGGGTKSLLGPGGLLASADTIGQQLENGNYLGAALVGLKTFNNFKGQNLGSLAGTELSNISSAILNGQNPLNKLSIPSLGGLLNTKSSPQSSSGSGQSVLSAAMAGVAGLGVGVVGLAKKAFSDNSPTEADKAVANSNGESVGAAIVETKPNPSATPVKEEIPTGPTTPTETQIAGDAGAKANMNDAIITVAELPTGQATNTENV